jgi:AcrR family transcriptional regulator
MQSELSPLKAQRRERILDAAERQFLTLGFRATTMEGLAEVVGMSKVTVYGYFKDKNAAFSAVADRLALRLINAVRNALDGEGNIRQRIRNALVAKHRLIFDLVRGSPHAEELFAAKDRMSAHRFRNTDRQIEELLAEALFKDGTDRSEALSFARLLFASSQGIANHADSFDEVQVQIARLVTLV